MWVWSDEHVQLSGWVMVCPMGRSHQGKGVDTGQVGSTIKAQMKSHSECDGFGGRKCDGFKDGQVNITEQHALVGSMDICI